MLLRTIGNPHHSFPSIHIAGTNGKGSTSCMIAAILTASDYRVGLYTSPHLVKFNERIRVNGVMISNADLVRHTDLLRTNVDAHHATFFEATTAIAFKYFQEQKVDIAVIETGLGGRLDATNVLRPLVSVITTIGKDHTQQLGKSLKSIAFEKGGIIKRGVPCVTGTTRPAAVRVLKEIAQHRHARFIHSLFYASIENVISEKTSQCFSLSTPRIRLGSVRLPLLGDHQRHNVQTAVTVLEQLERHGFRISGENIQNGLSGISQLTGIHGRLEILAESPLTILDVAHNPDGIRKTVAVVQALKFENLHLVFGVMKDKEYRAMIRLLSLLRPIVYAVQPKMERALEVKEIVHIFSGCRCTALAYNSVHDGLNAAIEHSKKEDMVLITGSHYVAGDVLNAWRKKWRKSS